MANDKNSSLADNYIEVPGDEKVVAQNIDDILDGKRKMVITTRSLPKTPVKLMKKNLKKNFKINIQLLL